MEKKRNIPVLRFSEYTGEWEIKKLGETTKQMQSGVSRKLSDIDIGLPILRSNNIQNGKLDVKDIKYWYLIDDQGVNLENYHLKNNDILVNFINSLAQIGKAALFENLLKRDTIFTTNLLRISFKDEVNTRFILYNFNLKNYKDYIQSITKPAVNQASFTTKEFQNYLLALPSLPEQTKIVAFLITVDERLTQLERKKNLLEQYKKGMLQKIFDQEIRFNDDKDNEFPDWEERNGNDIFGNISDKNHNSDLQILAITQEHGAIPRDLINFNISVMDKSVDSYKVVHIGDFIISLRSFQGGIEYSNYKGICSPAYIILRSKVEIDKRFYKFYFKTESYIKLLNLKLEGIRDGKMISYKYFSDILLPFPCLAEQTKIASFISAIDEKINCCTNQISKTEQYKKGLLQQMFV
ncbi:MAG TPA: restriction endonuclease subunit S [Prolixibacteraceae bacterium]|jgi:type I restriction enzyme S subunit